MAAVAALLVVVVARQQVLRRQQVADQPLAHDAVPVGRDLGRGHGPRRAAPALVDGRRDVFSPDFAQVIGSRQGSASERRD